MVQNLQLVAHRGYAARYPENTLPALQAAVDAGAHMLEFDIQLTRDHVPVLLHDASFARTAGDPACVHELDFADLQHLDVGEAARLDGRFAATPVDSLERVAEWLATQPRVMAFVEIKRQSIEAFGLESVCDAVLQALQPALPQCVVISFVAEALEEVRRRCSVPVGWAVRHYDDESRDRAQALAPEYLFCNVEKLPPVPEALWRGNWEWVIYEVVDAAVALELAERGVRLIETMACVELAQELAEQARA